MTEEKSGILNKQSSLICLKNRLVGDKGDAIRHQSAMVLDASFRESQFNHEGIQEPLMPLRDFL